MHTLALFIGTLASLLTLSYASLQSLDIYQWPLLPDASPSRLLSVNYDTTTGKATVSSHHSPSEATIANDDALIRVGLLDEDSNKWTGTVTRRSNLEAGKAVTLNLYVDSESSQVYHVSLLTSTTKHAAKDAAPHVNIVSPSLGPVPTLNKPVPVKPDGTPRQEVPEKTFIQKYWWIFAGMAVIGMLGNNEPQS